MIKDLFENIAKGCCIHFEYGRRDFHNLFDAMSEDDETTYMFLDPVKSKRIYSTDTGLYKSTRWTGRFFLVEKSDLDQVYYTQQDQPKEQGKFEMHLRPKYEKLNCIEKGIICQQDLTIENFDTIEVVNFLDANMDGIIVNFSILQQ